MSMVPSLLFARCSSCLGRSLACFVVFVVFLGDTTLFAQGGNGLASPPIVRPFPTVNRTTRSTISTTTPDPTKLKDDGRVVVLPAGTFQGTDNERHVRWWRVQVFFHAGGDRETYEQVANNWTGAVKGNLYAVKASDPNNPVVLATGIELELSQSSPEAVYLTPYIASNLHPLDENRSADYYTEIRFLLDATDGYTPSAVAAVNQQLRLTLSVEESFVYHFAPESARADGKIGRRLRRRVHRAPAAPIVTSAGMPGFRMPSGLSVATLTAKTSLTRSSWVCTFFGVNSACDET